MSEEHSLAKQHISFTPPNKTIQRVLNNHGPRRTGYLPCSLSLLCVANVVDREGSGEVEEEEQGAWPHRLVGGHERTKRREGVTPLKLMKDNNERRSRPHFLQTVM
uniref:Uncharacterized protein n=1 Tax=Lygus hesperus TaxID=30085 RepID=A0A0K8T7U3_LYGHE